MWQNSGKKQLQMGTLKIAVRIWTLFWTGDWKVPRTRRLESLRYT
jgi:hypothetical protein